MTFGIIFYIVLVISLNLCTLKRPANSNTLKTANKESKIPRLPISKPGSCSYANNATTKGSMATSQLGHSLIPKPSKCQCIWKHICISRDSCLILTYCLHRKMFLIYLFLPAAKSVEKNFGLKSSLQKVRGSQSKPKSSSSNLHLPVRELAKKTTKNLVRTSHRCSLNFSFFRSYIQNMIFYLEALSC